VAVTVLQDRLGLKERTIRELAQLSNGRIIGTGSGYVLTEIATEAEANEFIGRSRSQASRMLQRVDEVERVRIRAKASREEAFLLRNADEIADATIGSSAASPAEILEAKEAAGEVELKAAA
jgi:hypothetical protein